MDPNISGGFEIFISVPLNVKKLINLYLVWKTIWRLQWESSKHFLLSKASWRCPKDIFSVTTVGLTRRLQDVFAKCLLKASSRCLSSTSWRYDAFASRLQDYLQDVSKTSSIRLHQGECLLVKFICHLTINHSANLKCQFPQIW